MLWLPAETDQLLRHLLGVRRHDPHRRAAPTETWADLCGWYSSRPGSPTCGRGDAGRRGRGPRPPGPARAALPEPGTRLTLRLAAPRRRRGPARSGSTSATSGSAPPCGVQPRPDAVHLDLLPMSARKRPAGTSSRRWADALAAATAAAAAGAGRTMALTRPEVDGARTCSSRGRPDVHLPRSTASVPAHRRGGSAAAVGSVVGWRSSLCAVSRRRMRPGTGSRSRRGRDLLLCRAASPASTITGEATEREVAPRRCAMTAAPYPGAGWRPAGPGGPRRSWSPLPGGDRGSVPGRWRRPGGPRRSGRSDRMDVQEILTRATDSAHVGRVFGEPVERDGWW